MPVTNTNRGRTRRYFRVSVPWVDGVSNKDALTLIKTAIIAYGPAAWGGKRVSVALLSQEPRKGKS